MKLCIQFFVKWKGNSNSSGFLFFFIFSFHFNIFSLRKSFLLFVLHFRDILHRNWLAFSFQRRKVRDMYVTSSDFQLLTQISAEFSFLFLPWRKWTKCWNKWERKVWKVWGKEDLLCILKQHIFPGRFGRVDLPVFFELSKKSCFCCKPGFWIYLLA